MGLNYGFDIYCHRSKVWEFIDSVIELGTPHERYTTIILGDQHKTVPLRYQSNTYFVDDPNPDYSFSLSIPHAVDDVLKEYVGPDWSYDNQGRVYLGCDFAIYGDLDSLGKTGFDADLVWFEFRAASSDMSRMFRRSRSVQQTFVELAKKHEAAYCLFATGGQGTPTVLWLDGKEYSVDIPDDFLPMAEVRQIVGSASPVDKPEEKNQTS